LDGQFQVTFDGDPGQAQQQSRETHAEQIEQHQQATSGMIQFDDRLLEPGPGAGGKGWIGSGDGHGRIPGTRVFDGKPCWGLLSKKYA
jgi:hypothetical protein